MQEAFAAALSRLPFKAIIHVAGINLLWRSSESAIRSCVRSALKIAHDSGYRSIAFPLIGAGTGGMAPEKVQEIMRAEAVKADFDGEVRIVRLPDKRYGSRATGFDP
jgi:O-acetyl-ADP-ribose deacetylase (regulator of RNase III)